MGREDAKLPLQKASVKNLVEVVVVVVSPSGAQPNPSGDSGVLSVF